MCELVVKEVKKIHWIDRIMVYSVECRGAGEVIAEDEQRAHALCWANATR